jgi:pyruvate/2-oxoglutarate dehydrogenase complex dihydrolipoamide acyltransferase (E2) component
VTDPNSLGSLRQVVILEQYATLTPMTEEEIVTAYRDRLNAGDYANDGPEAEANPTLEPEQVGEQPDEESAEDVAATKAAQDRADELGVDLASVQGSGLNGRVTVGDVEAAYESAASA